MSFTDPCAPSYIGAIRRIPLLEAAREHQLATNWRQQGDRAAAHELVTSHLRLVAKIANQYRNYGFSIRELVAEGNVGLMQAANGFDPDKGARFSTYATWWIKARIQEYILHSWSLVKIGTTINQKRLFFNLRRTKGQIAAREEGELRPDQVEMIATALRVTKSDVVSMDRRLRGDVSLNAPLRDDGESGELQDWLVDDGPNQENILAESEESSIRRTALISALRVLNARERRIFEARWLAEDPMTLEQLASQFGISPERVRQIEQRAFQKVQKETKAALLQHPSDDEPLALVA